MTRAEEIKHLEAIVRPKSDDPNVMTWKEGPEGDRLQLLYEIDHFERLKRQGFATNTRNPVVYDEELAGPNGMYFFLMREPHHTLKDIAEAKRYLRRTRDVVAICVRQAPREA